MNFQTYLFVLILLVSNVLTAQNRSISGLVIDESLLGMPQVLILSANNNLIGTTDRNGHFIINDTTETTLLKFRFIGMQEEVVELTPGCDNAQVILISDWIIDYVSLKRAERIIQRKRKKNIPKLLKQAMNQKIFDEDKMCSKQKIIE